MVATSAFSTFDAIDPTKQVITDGERFERLLRFLNTRKHLVLDYETSGLAWYQHAEAIGIALGSWDDAGNFWASYTPFRHVGMGGQLDIEVIRPALGKLLARSDTLKIAHNIKFEDHISRREGWVVGGPRYDTMVASRLYDENRPKNLEYRASTDGGMGEAAYAGKNLITNCIDELRKQARMKKKDFLDRYGYSLIPYDLLGYYAGCDITSTARLFQVYERLGVSAQSGRIWPTEMALTEVLCDIEENGLLVDIPYLTHLHNDCLQKMEVFEQRFRQVTGGAHVNFGSDDQICDYMQAGLGLRWDKRTKGNKLAVDHEVLSFFAEQYEPVRLILEWRDVEKIASTYTKTLVGRCDDRGFLHGDFDSMGTNTGRLSCSKPNFQNMPSGDRVRTAFLVEPGNTRMFLDYSQVELRVLAWFSRDPIMLDVYANDGDIHERTRLEVSSMLGKEIPRRHAKVVNFGLSYGLTDRGLSRQSGMDKYEAEKFMDAFFKRYAGISAFRKKLWSMARRNNCSWTNPFGRRRTLTDLKAPEGWKRGSAERRMIGSAIQGTASELTKESLVRLSQYIKHYQIPAKICNTVHDEIQIDVDSRVAREVLVPFRQMMENYPEFHPVPIKADAEFSNTNWAQKKPVEEFYGEVAVGDG